MIEVYQAEFRSLGEKYEIGVPTTIHEFVESQAPGYENTPEHRVNAYVNGALVDQGEWRATSITPSDQAQFVLEPRGGAALVGAIVAAVVAVAAATLLRPSIPSVGGRGSRQGSSIYEVNAQGNKPKLGDVIPEQAGRHKAFPDYLTPPRRYFIDRRTQALDMLLCVGAGEYEILPDNTKIGSTPITNIGNDVDYEIFPPGASVAGNIAHRRWFNAPEVGAGTGSSGLRLKGLSERLYETTVAASADTLSFGVPADWAVDMRLHVDITQDITVTDGGTATTETEVVTAVDTSGTSSSVVTGVEVTRDVNGNVIDVTSTTGEALDGTSSVISSTTIEVDRALPDTLSGDFTGLAPGMRVRIKGGDISGVYLVATLSSGDMTLSTLGGSAVSDLPAGGHRVSIDRDGVTYSIDEIVGDRDGVRASRYLSSGDIDPVWSAFPTGTWSARVAVDIESSAGIWTGPFLSCPEGETTTRIEWDIFAPQGLGRIDNDGDIHARELTVEMQYRPLGSNEWRTETIEVDGGSGEVIGGSGLGNLFKHFIEEGSSDQLGWTFAIDVPAMTPEVRVRRTNAESDDTQILDRLEWYGLRSELPANTSYPGVTVIALTINGSDTIASQTENQINIVATRKIPRWDGSSWTLPESTRDISAWVRYIAHSVGYTDADIDMDELIRLHDIWTARGETFDYIQDEPTTVKEALNTVLRAGMAELTTDGGFITPVRDAPRTTPEHMYSPQNYIEGGGLQVSVTTPRRDDPDGINVEYFDENSWTVEIVKCRLPGDSGFRAEKVRIDGVTSRLQAWRIGMRERSRQKYARWQYRFSTPTDALNSNYLSYCVVAGEVPGFAQSAIIEQVSEESDGVHIESSEPLDWNNGVEHVVSWRRDDGSYSGAWPAERGDDDYHVIAQIPTGEVPVIQRNMEPPHLLFGEGFHVLVRNIEPDGESVDVTAENYDERVYASDDAFPA